MPDTACEPSSALTELVRLGERLAGELVIDCHTHLGPWFNFHIPDNGVEGMIRVMDRVGVQACAMSPHAAIGPDYRRGNEQVAEALCRFPERIIMYVTINPNYPEAEIAQELEKWASGPRCAFKIHPGYHQHRADSDKLAPMWEIANAKGSPVLSHSWSGCAYGSPKILGELAQRYPNAQVIVAHSMASYEMIQSATEEGKRRENMHLDITGSLSLFGGIEMLVDGVGADKVLFGSDMPFIDLRPAIGRVCFARIPDGDKRKILGLNAKRLFGARAQSLAPSCGR